MSNSPVHREMSIGLVIFLTVLGLACLPALEREAAGKDKKGEENKAVSLLDALVNRNKPPKLLDTKKDQPSIVALYPEDHDWEEEFRVNKALWALEKDTSTELWEEMIKRAQDKTYCVISTNVNTGCAYQESVGNICRDIAHQRLVGVVSRKLPIVFDGRRLSLPLFGEGVTLMEWRKNRSDKEVYKLQIELSERAIRELAKQDRVSKEEKEKSIKLLEEVIGNLNRTKRHDFGKLEMGLLPFREFRYDPKLAKEVRDAVKHGTLNDFYIVK